MSSCWRVSIIFAGLLIAQAGAALGQSSAGYRVTQAGFGAGGGTSASASYTLIGSLPPFPGSNASGATYAAVPGFWHAGVLTPWLGLSAGSTVFSPQVVGTTSPIQTLFLTNTGSGVLAVSGLTVSGGAFSRVADTCGVDVLPGQTCSVSLVFSPASIGIITGMLTVASNAAGGPLQVPLSGTGQGVDFLPGVELGWNLLGNSLDTALDVAAVFGNQDSKVAGITDTILSVWKWNAADARWAFYSPQLTVAANASYAASQNFDQLVTIGPGEGYWVNTLDALTMPTQTGAPFNWNAAAFGGLPSGFNLIAHAAFLSPSEFNLLVSAETVAVPTGGFTSLWAWDAVRGNWYFYSPLLEAMGGLATVKQYAGEQAYLHFQDFNKTLGVGTGFWVNRP